DNVAGGRLIGEVFLAAGARTYVIMTGDPRGTTSQDRVRGFVERLLEEGIKRNQIAEIAGGSTYDRAGKAAPGPVVGEEEGKPDAVCGGKRTRARGRRGCAGFGFWRPPPRRFDGGGFRRHSRRSEVRLQLDHRAPTDRPHGRGDPVHLASRRSASPDRAWH